jgi:hypothetical protein
MKHYDVLPETSGVLEYLYPPEDFLGAVIKGESTFMTDEWDEECAQDMLNGIIKFREDWEGEDISIWFASADEGKTSAKIVLKIWDFNPGFWDIVNAFLEDWKGDEITFIKGEPPPPPKREMVYLTIWFD